MSDYGAYVGREVEAFFAAHAPEASQLVLDGTGVTATKHYPVLAAIGMDRLARFQAVHAFSGGAFAYFGFHAFTNGHVKGGLETVLRPAWEAAFRRIHHRGPLAPLPALAGLALRRSAFGSDRPLLESIDFIFADAHLSKTLAAFPANLTIYVGRRGARDPLGVTAAHTGPAAALAAGPIRALTAASCLVPIVYGRPGRADEFHDAVFTDGYRAAIKALSARGVPTLVVTPWRHGVRGDVRFLKCSESRRPRQRMLVDFARLLLNRPNREWARDIALAFGPRSAPPH